MKVLAALSPSSLVALAVLSGAPAPATAFRAPADPSRHPQPSNSARNYGWANRGEGGYRDAWQAEPATDQRYYDEPSDPQAFGRGGYGRQYRDEYDSRGGDMNIERGDYYDESAFAPRDEEYRQGVGRSYDDGWGEQYVDEGQRQNQQYGSNYGPKRPYQGDYEEPQYPSQRWWDNPQPQYQNDYGPIETYANPQTPYEQQDYQGEYSSNGGGYRDEGYYGPSPPQRGVDKNYSFERRPVRGYESGDSYYDGSERRQYEGRNFEDQEQQRRLQPRPPTYGYMQKRDEDRVRPSEIVRGNPFGSGSIDRMMGGMMGPLAGFRMMDRMMDEMMMNPFGGFGMMDHMMARFDTEMQMGLGQASIEDLLDDAHSYLVADPMVTDMLGDGIRLGQPFARSSSSAVVNGMRKSHIQLGVPITGSLGTGRLRLVADEEIITQLQLDVEGRMIDIPIGTRRDSNNSIKDEDIIDATVVDKETY